MYDDAWTLANSKSTLLLDSGTDFVLYGGEVLLDKHKCCRLDYYYYFFSPPTQFRLVQYHCYRISAVDCTSSFYFPKYELFGVYSSMLWFSSIVMKSDWLICNLIIVHRGVPVVLSDLIEMN